MSNMKKTNAIVLLSLCLALPLFQSGCATTTSMGLTPGTTARMEADAKTTLQQLYAGSPVASALGHKAKAILVFPDILKGGFMFGGQVGNGVLFQNGHVAGYYNTVAASYGFQAGLQKFGYVMFLMNDNAMQYLHKSDGWEVGVGPSIVVLDQGMAKSMTTTTLINDVYAFVFNQTGLMAGVGLQGSKITEIQP